MAKRLPDESQIHVASHKVRRQRVFKHMGMPFFGGNPCRSGHCLEHAKELGTVEPTALLRSKEVIRAIFRPFTEPRPEGGCFIEQRLAAMRIQRLDSLKGAFKTPDRNPALSLNIAQFEETKEVLMSASIVSLEANLELSFTAH